MLAVGLMSGTSLDGIDAALVRIVPQDDSYAIDLLNFITVPFDEELDRALRAALPPNTATAAILRRTPRIWLRNVGDTDFIYAPSRSNSDDMGSHRE